MAVFLNKWRLIFWDSKYKVYFILINTDFPGPSKITPSYFDLKELLRKMKNINPVIDATSEYLADWKDYDILFQDAYCLYPMVKFISF